MDLARLRRAPAGVARRARQLAAAREQRRFRTRLAADPEAPILLLSPHWDDAVFDCWSLLTSDAELRVVNVFGGVPPPGPARRWDRICGGDDGAEMARRRIAEDERALAQAGRGAVNLALLDAEYREPAPDPSLDELDAAIAAAAPRASAVYAPACLGTNPDHRLVRRYARALHAQGLRVSLYADIPYCTVHGWPHWVDGREPDPHRRVDLFWMTFLVEVPEIPDPQHGRAVRLDPQRGEAKLQAMRAYETQLGALDGGPVGLLTNPAVHRFEVFWALDPNDPPVELAA
jgi:LmbE family N-acetylglucosaminyl deacetylase